jgi:putative hydrolase of the HAD superfamily
MHIIFDLSEVIISGLIGAEKEISRDLQIPEKDIVKGLNQPEFRDLMMGKISEDDYFNTILKRAGWDISIQRLKEIVRLNFHKEMPGTKEIALRLSERYPVTLLSDNAREWIEYIEKAHDFFDIFDQRLYSFALGKTKKDATLFQEVKSLLSIDGDRCIFIDDHQSNLDNAAKHGIEGILFQSADLLKHELREKGIITGLGRSHDI